MKYVTATAIVLILAACIMVIGPRWANAQGAQCGPTQKIMEYLATKFDESPVGAGLTDQNGSLFTVLASAKGTWTIIFSTPDGKSCIGGSGTDWMAQKSKIKGLDS